MTTQLTDAGTKVAGMLEQGARFYGTYATSVNALYVLRTCDPVDLDHAIRLPKADAIQLFAYWDLKATADEPRTWKVLRARDPEPVGRDPHPAGQAPRDEGEVKVDGTCRRCAGTGMFVTHVVNGRPQGPGGICFRCNGKGHQDEADRRRNWGYDRYGVRA